MYSCDSTLPLGRLGLDKSLVRYVVKTRFTALRLWGHLMAPHFYYKKQIGYVVSPMWIITSIFWTGPTPLSLA
jgi:hypothetical protein